MCGLLLVNYFDRKSRDSGLQSRGALEPCCPSSLPGQVGETYRHSILRLRSNCCDTAHHSPPLHIPCQSPTNVYCCSWAFIGAVGGVWRELLVFTCCDERVSSRVFSLIRPSPCCCCCCCCCFGRVVVIVFGDGIAVSLVVASVARYRCLCLALCNPLEPPTISPHWRHG